MSPIRKLAAIMVSDIVCYTEQDVAFVLLEKSNQSLNHLLKNITVCLYKKWKTELYPTILQQ